jgi:hypothetical protein
MQLHINDQQEVTLVAKLVPTGEISRQTYAALQRTAAAAFIF